MQVTALYRHPIKSHGREEISEVILKEGQSMPFDRHWAIAHDNARTDGTAWAPCVNFSRGASVPQLMAIDAKLDEAAGTLTLTHPGQDTITVNPDTEADELLAWVKPLVPQDRAQPAEVHRLAGRGFTDTDFPSISLCNTASHAAVESLGGTPLSPLRWRGNIWFDGAHPWEEFKWVGQKIKIGEAILHVEAPIQRCKATTANPETGERDADTLRTLNILGHQDFGIYARVITTGKITTGATLELI